MFLWDALYAFFFAVPFTACLACSRLQSLDHYPVWTPELLSSRGSSLSSLVALPFLDSPPLYLLASSLTLSAVSLEILADALVSTCLLCGAVFLLSRPCLFLACVYVHGALSTFFSARGQPHKSRNRGFLFCFVFIIASRSVWQIVPAQSVCRWITEAILMGLVFETITVFLNL